MGDTLFNEQQTELYKVQKEYKKLTTMHSNYMMGA